MNNGIKSIKFIALILPLMLFLFACSGFPTSDDPGTKEPVAAIPSTKTVNPSLTPSSTPSTIPTKITPTPTIHPSETKIPVPMRFSEPGPYHAGNRVFTLVDETRNGREIKILIWYPALEKTDDDGKVIVRDAEADTSSAPYPVILTEENSGKYIFLSHLASHGFVLVVVKDHLSVLSEQPGEFLFIDPLRDFLFTLDHISSVTPEGLDGVMDTDNVGVVGYSYGGDITLAISGARVDPEFYLSQCDQLEEIVPALLQWVYTKWVCLDANNWESFNAYVGDEITTSDDGLWQPITDGRIRAVMPMAPTISWYFGKRGLAAVDRPIFLVWGSKDLVSPYELEAAYTFENLETPDRILVSFIGRTHMMPFFPESVKQLKHFAVAFFGYHLEGWQDYLEYFSEEYISQFDDLVWGVYEE